MFIIFKMVYWTYMVCMRGDLMTLLLGNIRSIRKYLFELRESGETDFDWAQLETYPDKELHFQEWYSALELIRDRNDEFFSTQSKEFIDYLIESDLCFEICRVKEVNHEILVAKTTKEDAIMYKELWNMEWRA